MGMARGAYAANTWRAWRSDWKAFTEFSVRTNHPLFPSTPEAVRAFVFDLAARKCAVATLRRMRSSIARVHMAAGYADPTRSEPVRLALRECARQVGTRQRQARGLVWAEIAAYLARPAATLRDLRDRALVCVAYDGSLRPEELVGVDLEHICFEGDGPATLLIPSSKTDPEGDGAIVPMVSSTVALVRTFLAQATIERGALFRRVVGRQGIGGRLTTQSVTDLFQRIGRTIGLAQSDWQELSGHSARVGSTQDLFAAGMELPAIMQQGRWKDARMPARYGERLLAQRGAMMKLAEKQGRART
jgi:site-specific recombinase XerD